MLHTQEKKLNNGGNMTFFLLYFCFLNGGSRGLILEHFWYNSEPLRYIWFQEMLMKYVACCSEIFFVEKLHNLLRFCVHFAPKFANHALSEIILLREVGRITFDVSSRVQEYVRSLPLPPPNKCEKLHNLDFGTFSKLISWK